jgi:hypothetical protein
VIAICLLAGALIDASRNLRKVIATPLLPPPKPYRRYGVHWDEDLAPLCPACDTFLPIWDNDGQYEILWCPKCKEHYRLRDDYGDRVSLVDAKLEIEDQK